MARRGRKLILWAALGALALGAAGLGLYRFGGRIALRVQGYHTPLHIVVFESDDWHLAGTPDRAAYEAIVKKAGALLVWQKYSQETPEDLERLFEVLGRHKGANGRPPCFTANVVMKNPDLQAIRANSFTAMRYLATETDWPEPLRQAYRKGIAGKVWYPQLHGLDHMIADEWLRHLKDPDSATRWLFNLGSAQSPEVVLGKGENHRAQFVDISGRPSRAIPLARQQAQLAEAMAAFESVFGYRSASLIPPDYFSDDNTFRAAAAVGIRYIQAGNMQCEGVDAAGRLVSRVRSLGQQSGHGPLFLIRNCAFEPRHGAEVDPEKSAREAKTAFAFHQPAVFDSHSLNYVSRIDPDMSRQSLKQLDRMLTAIETAHPDVLYLTSPELGDLIATGGYTDAFSGRRIEMPASSESTVRWLAGNPYVDAAAVALVAAPAAWIFLLRRSARRAKGLSGSGKEGAA